EHIRVRPPGDLEIQGREEFVFPCRVAEGIAEVSQDNDLVAQYRWIEIFHQHLPHIKCKEHRGEVRSSEVFILQRCLPNIDHLEVTAKIYQFLILSPREEFGCHGRIIRHRQLHRKREGLLAVDVYSWKERS